MMISSEQLINYHGAVRLNNIGLALLERGAYRQALNTFKDAVANMRFVFPSKNEDSRGKNDLLSDIDMCITRARQRLVSPEGVHEKSSFIKVESISIMKKCSVAKIRSIINSEPSISHFYPLYITEVSECCTNFEDRDIHTESAIMVYNFATAHAIVALCDPSRSKHLRKAAHRLFALCQNILEQQLDACEDFYQETSILLVSSIVAHSLVHSLFESGSAIRSHLERLDRLAAIVNNLNEFDSIPAIHVAAAA